MERNLSKIAAKLNLPYYSAATSLWLLQRYKQLNHNTQEHIVLISCLSLGMKLEETVKKLRDISSCVCGVLGIQDTGFRDKVMELERVLLQESSFLVQIEHPFRFGLAIVKELDGSQDIAFKCWQLLTDCYYTHICISFPSHLLAFAAAYIAFALNGSVPVKLSENSYLSRCSVDLEQLEKCMFEMIQELTPLAEHVDAQMQLGRVKLDLQDEVEKRMQREREAKNAERRSSGWKNDKSDQSDFRRKSGSWYKHRDNRESRDNRDSRDRREGRDARDSRDSRDTRDNRDTKDNQDNRDNRDSIYFTAERKRAPQDARDKTNSRDSSRERSNYKKRRNSSPARNRNDRSDRNDRNNRSDRNDRDRNSGRDRNPNRDRNDNANDRDRGYKRDSDKRYSSTR